MVLEEPSDPTILDSMMASLKMEKGTGISEVSAMMEPITNLNGKMESILDISEKFVKSVCK
jgi:hypothetical protein